MLELLDKRFQSLDWRLMWQIKRRFCVDEISNLEEVFNKPIIVERCYISSSIQMSVKTSHYVCQVILWNYFWGDSMVFEHFIHFCKVHGLFPIFHILKASYCLYFKSCGWVFCVKKFEQTLEFLKTKLYWYCVSIFLFFINEKWILNNFVYVKSFLKLTDGWKIWCNAGPKSRNFWFLSDSKGNKCRRKSRCHCLLNFSLII